MQKAAIEPGDRVEVIDPASSLSGRILVVVRAVPEGAFLAAEEGGSSTAFLHYDRLRLIKPNAIHADLPTHVVAVLTEECMAELVDRITEKVVQSLMTRLNQPARERETP